MGDSTGGNDDYEYVIPYPSYFLACSFSGKSHEKIDVADDDIGIVGNLQHKILPIFTDFPGVEEFAAAMQLKNPLFGRLESKDEMLKFLKRAMERKQYDNIAIDPRTKPGGGPARAFSLSQFINSLEMD